MGRAMPPGDLSARSSESELKFQKQNLDSRPCNASAEKVSFLRRPWLESRVLGDTDSVT